MPKVILIRHAESTANIGDVAFGNFQAPLTDKAHQQQIPDAKRELIEKYGINPDTYDRPVAVSEYRRTQQTAAALGFQAMHPLEMLNESDIYHSDELAGVNVIAKHVDEGGWLPDQEIERAQKIIEGIRNGSLDYEIIVSHGMVIAGILNEINKRHGRVVIEPHPTRGHVPLQAQVIEVDV